MTRYMGFLRAINVGGRRVTNEQLRSALTTAGFQKVETFQASGNVVFDASEPPSRSLEERVEAGLQAALGFEVETFLRASGEVDRIVAEQPFPRELESEPASSVQVVFLSSEPAPATVKAVVGFQTETDRFHIAGRELYWLCRTRISDSQVPWPAIGRRLGGPTTTRNLSTLMRMLARFGTSPMSTEPVDDRPRRGSRGR